MKTNQPKSMKPKIRMEIKKWYKLVRRINAKRCKRSGPKTKYYECLSDQNTLDSHCGMKEFKSVAIDTTTVN
jgi:hypothetical protein